MALGAPPALSSPPTEEGGGETSGSGSAFASPMKEEEQEQQAEEEGEEKESDEAARLQREAEAAQKLYRTKLRTLVAALKNMVQENEAPALQNAVDMLVIYVNNLIKYPTIPRSVSQNQPLCD